MTEIIANLTAQIEKLNAIIAQYPTPKELDKMPYVYRLAVTKRNGLLAQIEKIK